MKQRHRKHRLPVRQFQWLRRAKWQLRQLWAPVWLDEGLPAATDLIIVKYSINDQR